MPLLHLRAFVACYRVNFTFTFTFTPLVPTRRVQQHVHVYVLEIY